MTVKELWSAAPKPDFPPFFLEVLDLDVMLTETSEKADNLKDKIDRRRSAEKKLQYEKAREKQQNEEKKEELRKWRLEQA